MTQIETTNERVVIGQVVPFDRCASALDSVLGRNVDLEALAISGVDYLTNAHWGDGEADDVSETDHWYLEVARMEGEEEQYPTFGEALKNAHKQYALGPYDPLPNLNGAYVKAVISSKLRWDVFRRNGYQCVYCGCDHDLTVDHILSERRGGATILENLQTLCRPCNSKKGAR